MSKGFIEFFERTMNKCPKGILFYFLFHLVTFAEVHNVSEIEVQWTFNVFFEHRRRTRFVEQLVHSLQYFRCFFDRKVHLLLTHFERIDFAIDSDLRVLSRKLFFQLQNVPTRLTDSHRLFRRTVRYQQIIALA